MSTLSLRLPDSLHAKVRELAERDDVSINQFIATAVAEKMSALITEEYLAARAKRGSRAAFRRVLARVPDVPPQPGDERPLAVAEERRAMYELPPRHSARRGGRKKAGGT